MELASAPGTYCPRACDCSFCRRHEAAYLSDPKGRVVIRTETAANLNIARQGAELAEFLFCAACAQLLGAHWQDGAQHYACVNAQALFARESLGNVVAASPGQLSAEQKIERWKALWFPAFSVITAKA
ncbi:aldehyde-activating protein [Pseudomonas sp. N040]|uniref:aldehyde-activating protein n=1 Tax=Pseudomonas sp. N040 TaxID=2785325 RepID=UPI0018A258C3|nr:aldehyde-activating protein [Pseudomonas sp. N040]MBF7731691.1 aldehyde-activating protein [Pseudomonas sp. N040]MBW7015335.1 hypothetical protein [Pseudomonas sp. N040]